MTSRTLHETCRSTLARFEGALACGVLDLRQGAFTVRHHRPHLPGALDPGTAVALSRLLKGPELDWLAASLRSVPGPEGADGPEVHIPSESSAVFAKVLRGGAAAVVLAADRATNLGLAWAFVKSLAAGVEVELETGVPAGGAPAAGEERKEAEGEK